MTSDCLRIRLYCQHICQLSRIIRESPGYGTNLPVSRTGHHISRIKATLDLFPTVAYFNCKFSLNPKKMRVFKCMFCFLTEFSSIFHPTCHGCLQKLGRPGPILQQVVVVGGGGGCGSRVIFWGLVQKKKISRFQTSRGWHLCVKANYANKHFVFPAMLFTGSPKSIDCSVLNRDENTRKSHSNKTYSSCTCK